MQKAGVNGVECQKKEWYIRQEESKEGAKTL
jgi:hypothetical protein